MSEPPEVDVEDEDEEEDDEDDVEFDVVLPPDVEEFDVRPDVVPEPPPADVEVCCVEPAVVFVEGVPATV